MSEINEEEAIKEEKQWVTSLISRDCKHLMALMRQHPHLWLKRAPGDRTVLHVAVMQGCLELVKLVLYGPYEAYDNQKEFQENLRELFHAKDGKCRADAFELSTIVGNQEVIKVLNSARQLGFLNGLSRHTSVKSTYVDPSKEFIDSLKQLPSYEAIDSLKESTELLKVLPSYEWVDFPKEFIDLLKTLPSYKSLQKEMKKDVDYNFEGQRKGLIFNFACKKVHSNIVFLRNVASKAREKPGLLQKLFTQMDAQGRTPLHVAIDHCRGVEVTWGIQELLQMMPDECVNGRDGAGRTPLLRATVNGMSLEASMVVRVLADDKRTDLNAEWPGGSGATALHLAVLHGHGPSAKHVLQANRDNPKERADVEKQMSRRIKVSMLPHYLKWTPLELAAVMGRHSVLVNILSAVDNKSRKAIRDERCMHLAAAAGDPRSMQALLLNQSNDLQHFETNYNFRGYSCLHFAVFASLPHQRSSVGKPFSVKAIDEAFDRFLGFSDFASIHWLQEELTRAARKGPQKLGMFVPELGVKKSCTIFLLRAGVDIWPSRKSFLEQVSLYTTKNSLELDEYSTRDGHDFHLSTTTIDIPSIPDPGGDASDDDRMWWFDLATNETLKAKNNFNAAGNATAVVATLVATASFIGPSTPPLGYGSDASSAWTFDHIQMDSLPIRVFMTSNSLSFYLAIASIMLAIMPSLPIPHEDLGEELHRNQRAVALAISMLLLSIFGLLVSFTSGLIAVLPQHGYWSFIFYPAFVGGIICSVVIFFFFLRVLRLVFNKNARIKKFYHFFGLL